MRLPSLKSPLTLAWLAAIWMGLFSNWPLWQRLWGLPELANLRGHVFVAVFVLMVICLQGALLSLFAWRSIIKPVLALMLLSAASLAYFISAYGTVIDPTMVVNIVQTDAREARDLLSPGLLMSLALLGGVPIVWLWRQPMERGVSWKRRLGFNALGLLAGVVLSVLLILGTFADFAATMRSYPAMRYMISPVNAFYSAITVAVRSGAKPKGPPEVIGADAKLAPRAGGAKPPLLVLVVGETARAANFSLLGYARPTNPELAKLPGVLAFGQVHSCGTSTAASLPCMFSPLGREEFGQLKHEQENLLDVLQRAGLAVLWLDNQSGCKGQCERVPHEELCGGQDECMDEALLQGLDGRIARLDPARAARGVVLVLHQMGSHGPAYYKRSPPQLKPFQPECKTNALQQCAREEVVNGYDNSLVYTDHVLAGAVTWLQSQQARFDTSLYYVSDHGESLGEKGLYLHGVPYAFAPEEQKHVPMVMWLGQDPTPLSTCLKQRLNEPLSHDNLFHTVLGIMGVQTSIYRADRDLTKSCRAN